MKEEYNKYSFFYVFSKKYLTFLIFCFIIYIVGKTTITAYDYWDFQYQKKQKALQIIIELTKETISDSIRSKDNSVIKKNYPI